MKIGLVMEGGAMRGLFSAGVIDVLMENDIVFDGAVGVSAGACFGCNYKSHQPRRAIRYSTRFCKDKRYCSVRSLITTGDMFGAEFCYHKIPDELDLFDFETFRNDPMEFYIVCTDIETGKPVYRRVRNCDREDLEWIRASASMPLAARIVKIGERKLMDGGISDSIPLRFMEKTGFEKNVVIVTQPRDYSKKPDSTIKLIRAAYRRYPDFVKACEHRPKMYNDELSYMRKSESEGKAFVIAPSERLPINHIEHDSEVLLDVYRRGRKAANECIEELMAFMSDE